MDCIVYSLLGHQDSDSPRPVRVSEESAIVDVKFVVPSMSPLLYESSFSVVSNNQGALNLTPKDDNKNTHHNICSNSNNNSVPQIMETASWTKEEPCLSNEPVQGSLVGLPAVSTA